MSPDADSRLLRLLADEQAALEEILTALGAEEAALKSRQPEALLAASNAKAELVARAARLERERRDLLKDGKRPPAAARQGLQVLRDLARRCRERNEANGQMIRGQRRRVEGALNLLRTGSASAETYGSDGASRSGLRKKLPLASF
jgi:flagellar biosynthesis/type III secretory pathway chaperone